MKHLITFSLIFVAITFCLTDCNAPGTKQADHAAADSTFKKSLQQKQLGESGYFLSIPSSYTIKVNEGPDFYVYYFSPADTAINAEFSGGIYFGNHPSEFEPDSDSCKIETLQGYVLNKQQNRKLFTCHDWLSVQTIIENKSTEGWNERIHAFGGASSRENLSKVMMIYTTMRKKKK